MILAAPFPSGYSSTHLTRCKILTFAKSGTSDIPQTRAVKPPYSNALRRSIRTAAARHPAQGSGRQRPEEP